MQVHTEVLVIVFTSLLFHPSLSPTLHLFKLPTSECDHAEVLSLGALPNFLIYCLSSQLFSKQFLKLFRKENTVLGNILLSFLSRARQARKCSINVCWVRRKWNLSVQLQRKSEPDNGGLCSKMCTWWICLNFSLVFTAVTFMGSQQTNESSSLVLKQL